MAYDAGTAFLQVQPSFVNVDAMLTKAARDIANGLDKRLGKALGGAMQNASKDAERQADRAGQAMGKTFADGAIRNVHSAMLSISKDDRVLAPIRKELEAISQIDLGKGFDEKDFIKRVERAYDALRNAQQDANGVNAVGRFTDAGNAATLLGAVKEIVKAAHERGFAAGDAFSDAYVARLNAMDRALPDQKITKASSPDQRDLAAIKARVQDAKKLNIGDTVTRDNNPLNLKIGTKVSGADLARELGVIEGLLDQFSERSGTIELTVASDRARKQAGAFFEDVKTEAQKAAEAEAVALQRERDAAHAEALKSREKELADEQALALRTLRSEQAARQRELDTAHAEALREREKEDSDAQRAALQAAEERLAAARREIAERAKLTERNRQAELAAARRETDDRAKVLRQAREQEQRDREEAFKRSAIGQSREGTSKAADALSVIPVHLQTSALGAELQKIREKLNNLGTISVHIDEKTFGREVEAQFERLKQIAHDEDIDITVRADAARAATELGAVLVLMKRLDHDKAKVTVDADTDNANRGLQEMLGALSLNLGRLGALIAVGASIGSAIVPAAAAAASAIGFIGTAALAAGAGLGVMLLGFSGIGDAVKAMSQLADDQAKSKVSLARSGDQIVGALAQVKGAEMALANTRENNRLAAVRAQREIRDAIAEAGQANADAAERYTESQRDLTRAEEAAKQTRVDLTEAYRDAQRAIDDLNSSVRGNALNQRQATLDIAKAKEELDKALSNPRADAAQREQAQISYEQRLLQMDDLKRKGGELNDEQEQAFKDGVAGSKQVTKARQNVLDADEQLVKTQRALAKAAKDVTTIRKSGLQKIADAQQAAADQQRQAAYSQFTATQSLEAAQRSLKSAYDKSGIAGGAALDNVKTAMGKLSPTAQRFAEYIFGLKDAFLALRQAADPVVAGVQRALESLVGKTSKDAITKLQPLFSFVHDVAEAMGSIFERFAATLQGPTFTKFFKYVRATAVPTLQDMYTAFENILVGVTNLFLAFTPLTGEVEDGFVGMTEKFRDWSESLGSNKGFQDFVKYMRESGPRVLHFLVEAAKSFGGLIKAAAPIGSKVIDVFTQLFEWINKIPEKTLDALVIGITAAAVALTLFAGVTAVMALEVAGLVAGGIAILVVALAGLIGSSDEARGALGTAWEVIKTGAIVAFNALRDVVVQVWAVLKPLWAEFAATVMDLYYGAVEPAMRGIWEVIQVVYGTIKPILELIWELLKFVGQVVIWLYKYAFLPAFKAIVWVISKILVPVIKWLWEVVVKPIFASLGLAFRIFAAIVKVAIGLVKIILISMGIVFRGLWEQYLKPTWEKHLKPFFETIAHWIDKNIKPYWDKAIKALGDAWGNLKKLIGVPVKFIVETLLNDGILKGYNWLADKFDIEPKNVKIDPPTGGWGYATGGAIRGRGTGTSDDIPIMASNGEHMLTAAEVRAAGGHQAIYAWRRALLGGGPGAFAKGGAIGDGLGGWLKKIARGAKEKATDAFQGAKEFLSDPLGSLKMLGKALFDKVPGKDTWFVQRLVSIPTKILATLEDKVKDLFGGDSSSNAGGQDGAGTGVMDASNVLGGSGGMMNILRAVFPGLNMNSGFRPGAITVTGNRSYHSRNRAVDLPPRGDVFEWIRANYPDSRELIFSPKGDRQLWNGKPHVYSGAVKKIHYSHVHWAYDQGGLLPDTRNMPGGTMQVFHGKRTPDKVLTDQQWTSMSTLASKARSSMESSTVYNFKDATLDHDRLDAIHARRDALARVNRPNW